MISYIAGVAEKTLQIPLAPFTGPLRTDASRTASPVNAAAKSSSDFLPMIWRQSWPGDRLSFATDILSSWSHLMFQFPPSTRNDRGGRQIALGRPRPRAVRPMTSLQERPRDRWDRSLLRHPPRRSPPGVVRSCRRRPAGDRRIARMVKELNRRLGYHAASRW